MGLPYEKVKIFTRTSPPYHNFKEIKLKNNLGRKKITIVLVGRSNYGKGVIFIPLELLSWRIANRLFPKRHKQRLKAFFRI